MKKYTHVTIDRRKWHRGGDAGLSSLRLKSGKQCCLGFAARELGAKTAQIFQKGMPGDVDMSLPGLNKSGFFGFMNTRFSHDASEINDDPDITDRQREAQLRKLARQNGFIFKFIN